MKIRQTALFPVLILSLLTGCASTAPVRYYTLAGVEAPLGRKGEGGTEAKFTLGLGPVEIPDYLERPQIVTRNGSNEMLMAEHDRWAGALKHDISRVLSENLAALLPEETSILFWKRNVPFDCRVAVDITRIDIFPGREVKVGAQWVVFVKDRKGPVSLRSRTFSEPLPTTDYSSAVAAVGKAIGGLSAAIAADVAAASTAQEKK
jgi:uncharacterized lipoprotein YmbA